MTSFIEVFQNNPMAVIFGAMGLACQLIWPIFSQRSRILSVQFGIGANYGIQYARLNAWTTDARTVRCGHVGHYRTGDAFLGTPGPRITSAVFSSNTRLRPYAGLQDLPLNRIGRIPVLPRKTRDELLKILSQRPM